MRKLETGSEGEEISWGAVEMRVAFWGVLGKLRKLETGSEGEEISWGEVEMRLHFGEFWGNWGS